MRIKRLPRKESEDITRVYRNSSAGFGKQGGLHDVSDRNAPAVVADQGETREAGLGARECFDPGGVARDILRDGAAVASQEDQFRLPARRERLANLAGRDRSNLFVGQLRGLPV